MSLDKVKFDYRGYEDYLYTGLQGFVMRCNHKILSANLDPSSNRKILEIGGAAKPHFSLVPLEGVKEYWISDASGMLPKVAITKFSKPGVKIKTHDYDDDPAYSKLAGHGHRFSRIIASHVWEHVNDPEAMFLRWIDLLDDGGQLDIAIPCDPGWAWRLGQLVGRRKAIRAYQMSSPEIDLMMSREHVNPCQNLLKIARYYTRCKPRFFPLILPLTDVNLFAFLRIRRQDLRHP